MGQQNVKADAKQSQKGECGDCLQSFDMYCFEKDEFFCAKCDFKQHSTKHSQCEGESNKEIQEIKEQALKEISVYNLELIKFKSKLKNLLDNKDQIKLFQLESFLRLAVFHFKKLDFVREEWTKHASNSEHDFELSIFLASNNKNYTDLVNQASVKLDVREVWKIYNKKVTQYYQITKFAITVIDDLQSSQTPHKTRHEIQTQICQKLEDEKYEFTCKVNGTTYLSLLSTQSWLKLFNLYFHYVYLKDTYLFFPQQQTKRTLSDQDKIEFVALQIQQQDQKMELSKMYQCQDKDAQTLAMLKELLSQLESLSREKLTIKPFFINALVYIQLAFIPKYQELQSKFNEAFPFHNHQLKYSESLADLAKRIHDCIYLQIITLNKEVANQLKVNDMISLLTKVHKFAKEIIPIQDNEELQSYIAEKSYHIEEKYLYSELLQILMDEDFLEEKSGIRKTNELQLQMNQRKLFMQIVYEMKHQEMAYTFVNQANLSYQPLRKIGDNQWYEGQWSNTLCQQYGAGLVLIIDVENFLEKREIFVGQLTDVEQQPVNFHSEENDKSSQQSPQISPDQFLDQDEDEAEQEQETLQTQAQLITGLLNGLGVHIWSDGTSYNGDWVSNERHGFGVYEWPDGSSYSGNWKRDQWSGEGTYTNKYGIIFKGNWQDNLLLPGLIELHNHKRLDSYYKIKIEEPMLIDSLDKVQRFKDFKYFNILQYQE